MEEENDDNAKEEVSAKNIICFAHVADKPMKTFGCCHHRVVPSLKSKKKHNVFLPYLCTAKHRQVVTFALKSWNFVSTE